LIDLWQRANQDPKNTQIKKRKWAWITEEIIKQHHQIDRPSNGTHKAKEAEDDLETPGVETHSQN
jgi:hypothetical protein